MGAVVDAAGAPASRDDFEVLAKIGQGAFGAVYKAKRRADGALRVLKSIEVVGLSRKEQEDALNEVRILASLAHAHIVRYDDSFVDGTSMHIVMEYCAHGDVRHALEARQGKLLPEPTVWRWLLQVLLGLRYVHARRVLHRDLKTLNLFLVDEHTVRIGDFGVARLMGTHTDFARTMVGTPYYLSPELCENRPYGEKSDMWAVGVILYELCTLRHPFDAHNQGALILKILRGKYPPPPDTYSRPLRELVRLLLHRREERRPAAAALLAHAHVRAKARELGVDLDEDGSFGRGGAAATADAAVDAPPPQPQPQPQPPQPQQPPRPQPPRTGGASALPAAPRAAVVAAAGGGAGGAECACAAASGALPQLPRPVRAAAAAARHSGPLPASGARAHARAHVGGNRVRRLGGPGGLEHPSTRRAAAAARAVPAGRPAPQQPRAVPFARPPGGRRAQWNAQGAIPPHAAGGGAAAPRASGGASGGGVRAAAAALGIEPGPRPARPTVAQLQAIERGEAPPGLFVPPQPTRAPDGSAAAEEVAAVRALSSGRAGEGGALAETVSTLAATALDGPAPAAAERRRSRDDILSDARAAAARALASAAADDDDGSDGPSAAQGGSGDEVLDEEDGWSEGAEEEAGDAEQSDEGHDAAADAWHGTRGLAAAEVGVHWRVLNGASAESGEGGGAAAGARRARGADGSGGAGGGDDELLGEAEPSAPAFPLDGGDADVPMRSPTDGERALGPYDHEEEEAEADGWADDDTSPEPPSGVYAAELEARAAELRRACVEAVSAETFAELYGYFKARTDADAGAADGGAAPGLDASERSSDELVAFVYERIPVHKSETITKIFQLLFLEDEIREAHGA